MVKNVIFVHCWTQIVLFLSLNYLLLKKKNLDLSKGTENKYTAVNNVPIQILGIIRTSLRIKLLANVVLELEFQVIDSKSWPTDIILGRDFLRENQISLVFRPATNQVNDK